MMTPPRVLIVVENQQVVEVRCPHLDEGWVQVVSIDDWTEFGLDPAAERRRIDEQFPHVLFCAARPPKPPWSRDPPELPPEPKDDSPF
jgi:hypothetical protein